MKEPSNNLDRIKILDLGIFGLILFPFVVCLISLEMTNVFVEMERNRVNAITVVITETIISLNHCRITGKGSMRCRVHLLYMWLVSHMTTGEIVFRSAWWINQQPLKEFVEKNGNPIIRRNGLSCFINYLLLILAEGQFGWELSVILHAVVNIPRSF
jgi:hypothetical protein